MKKKASETQACRLLNISRAGYYAAQKRAQQQTVCVASGHLKAAFASSQQTFGSRRLLIEMHRKGFRIGRFKVRRLMREARLVPVWKRNKRCETARHRMQHESRR